LSFIANLQSEIQTEIAWYHAPLQGAQIVELGSGPGT
jgi:hypothetical protein